MGDVLGGDNEVASIKRHTVVNEVVPRAIDRIELGKCVVEGRLDSLALGFVDAPNEAERGVL